jgi:hypothetical protein
MHFERFKVHSRAQSASTNRTGFGVFLWCSSCLGQSTGEMPARHLSLSLSHSRSLPPSLPLFLSPSLSQHPGDVIGYLVRHGSPGSTRSVPADAVAACRTDSDPKSIGQPFSSPKPYDHHKHSTSPCKYMLDIKVRSECKREEDTGRSKREIARDSFDARPVALLRAYLTEPRSNLCSASRPEHGAVLGG